MSSRFALISTLAAAVALSSCAARRIPGTEIQDNADTRAIVQVIDQYRMAAERRDAAGVLALVSQRYFDDGGTSDPGDDQDFTALERRLPEDYAKLVSIKLGIGVKSITVTGDTAVADLFFDGKWRVSTPTGEVVKSANDVSRMKFIREQGLWKISSGL